MKTIELLLLALLFANCTPEEVQTEQSCTKSYYTWEKVGYSGGIWIYDYVLKSSEPTNEPQSDGFVSIDADNFYKIECE